MYGHGLATIAICEAYGMTTDPALRKPAQDAINLIIAAQHEYGAWRYLPEKTPAGDLSIFGWQCMALKTGQAAGLDVPRVNIARAKSFIEGVCNKKDEGYCYVANGDSTPTMTAVGVLCRQHQENWGPSHPRLRQAVDGIIKTNPPNPSDVYYTFHATQVMFHDGGNGWNAWNDQMRSFILEQQERNTKNANFGSFHPDTDRWGRQGGRLMVTSLNLLTLQVYYRHTHLSKNPYGGIW